MNMNQIKMRFQKKFKLMNLSLQIVKLNRFKDKYKINSNKIKLTGDLV